MSEQQADEWKSPCPHPEAVGTRWGDPISEERQAELKTLVDKQGEWAGKSEAERGQSRFKDVHLTGADLCWLKEASEREHPLFPFLDFEGAVLEGAHLEGVVLGAVDLADARLEGAHLDGAKLGYAKLPGALLSKAHLEGADLGNANLRGAILLDAHLERADLSGALLEQAKLWHARLDGARLYEAHLEGAGLWATYLEGARLYEAHLEGAYLNEAHLDSATGIGNAVLSDNVGWLGTALRVATRRRAYGSVSLADVTWNGANLTGVDWSVVRRLGDERTRRWWWRGRDESEGATRANIQVSKQLEDAGLKDDAGRFAYRAQVRQRGAYLLKLQLGRWLFSLLLATLAGYGYRLERVFITYALTVSTFALLFLSVGIPGGFPVHTSPLVDAFQLSFTAIHGRVSVESLGFGSTVAWVAGVESVCGIVIEGVLTAILVQRFFAR